ncbi:translation initiation factor [Porphyromonas pogonae]|uniref:translation initiation factor n=1 Tax=Porphyromonas pogonae TaxID=867595 RepID=UPI002E7AA996|nr:translation initiation factor [Porphyromonas pogonae]
MSDWKDRLGIMYSTNPNFKYKTAESQDEENTFPPEKQPLKVKLDKKNRNGKEVCLVTGFVGSDENCNILCKTLKQKCGVGGSAKDKQIIIQGNRKERVLAVLHELGYSKAKII